MRFAYAIVIGLALAAISTLSSCSDVSAESKAGVDTTDLDTSSGYADGTYCAEVTYHYARTGTTSTYTLLVDVSDNRLVKIHWPNGGWLDETHYTGPDIEDGDASFTSDIGADYLVRIQGEEGSCSLDSDATNEEEVAQEQEQEEEQPDQTSTEDEQE
jgi:hypothetical protein